MRNNFFDVILENLNSIPFHDNNKEMSRYIAKDAPYHIAIHEIHCTTDQPEEYVHLHKHGVEELNILVSDTNDLEYNFVVGGEERIVSAPGVVWIPKHTLHSANVIKGSGFFICIIFEKGYKAFNEENLD